MQLINSTYMGKNANNFKGKLLCIIYGIFFLIYVYFSLFLINIVNLLLNTPAKLYASDNKIIKIAKIFGRKIIHHCFKSKINRNKNEENKIITNFIYKFISITISIIPTSKFMYELRDLVVFYFEHDYKFIGSLTNGALKNLYKKQKDIYYIEGVMFLTLANWEVAAKYFEQSIKLKNNKKLAYFYLGVCYEYLGDYLKALDAYKNAIQIIDNWAQAMLNLAHMSLYAGDEKEAVTLLQKAIHIDPRYGMAHQNMAAIYDRNSYKPTELDKSANDKIILYDACNFVGERSIHIADHKRALELYGRALEIQEEICTDFKLPERIIEKLQKHNLFKKDLPVRILPYEWVTQIGHIAMLDTYLKMQYLDYLPFSNRILLAPEFKISNKAYLEYWQKYFIIITDQSLVHELFQYQRYIGDSFNGYLKDDGTPVLWTDIGAQTHIAWDSLQRGPLLKLKEEHKNKGREILEQLGVPENAWIVGLHVREAGYHKEGTTSIQLHRNAAIDDYIPAIKYIIDQGGYVIRMGDSTMQPSPEIHGLIDYARSDVKSDWMDIYLASATRFFIGTTSGLSNVAISFGTPCLLVNCVSNYSQLLNQNVVYTLKRFYSNKEKRYLSANEILQYPLKSRIFNLKALEKEGIVIVNNSSDDIEMSVKYFMNNYINGENITINTATINMRKNIERAAGNFPIYGNGYPCLSFFNYHYNELFGDDALCNKHDFISTAS